MTVLQTLIDTIENDIDHIVRVLNPSGYNVLVGDNYVVRTSQGLYLRYTGNDFSYASGILHCSRFPEPTARRIAPTVRDGQGNFGVAVPLTQALRDTLDEERALLIELLRLLDNQS